MLRNVADPIADLRRAVAAFRPGQERLAGGAEANRSTEARRRSFVEGDVNDADATVRADTAVLALQSASAGVDDALAEVERQLADAQLRLDPDRDQAARAAEALKREKEAEEQRAGRVRCGCAQIMVHTRGGPCRAFIGQGHGEHPRHRGGFDIARPLRAKAAAKDGRGHGDPCQTYVTGLTNRAPLRGKDHVVVQWQDWGHVFGLPARRSRKIWARHLRDWVDDPRGPGENVTLPRASGPLKVRGWCVSKTVGRRPRCGTGLHWKPPPYDAPRSRQFRYSSACPKNDTV
jgi:hypothetical protein